MRPCYFYAKNYGKAGFKCEYDEIESELYVRYKDNSDFIDLNNYCNEFCPKFADCVKLADETVRRFRTVNVTINNFGDGKIEVLYHKEPFRVPETVINDKSDRKRCFRLVNMDFLVPLKDSATLAKLHKSIEQSAKRSHDAFRGYSTANKWTYFFTFTFSPSIVDNRYNDYLVESLWQRFQDRLKKYDSGVKILNVPERHKNGAQHFHALITFSRDLPIVDWGDVSKLPQRTCDGGPNKGKTGFCTFNKDGSFTCLPKTSHKYFLVPYYDYGEIQRSSLGDMLFCLNKYPYGINSCAILPSDDSNQAKVGNYLSVYTTKESNLGYNKKRFMRTRNLDNKEKITLLMSEDELADFLQQCGAVPFKDGDQLTVYRNFNLDKTPGSTTVIERLER